MPPASATDTEAPSAIVPETAAWKVETRRSMSDSAPMDSVLPERLAPSAREAPSSMKAATSLLSLTAVYRLKIQSVNLAPLC